MQLATGRLRGGGVAQRRLHAGTSKLCIQRAAEMASRLHDRADRHGRRLRRAAAAAAGRRRLCRLGGGIGGFGILHLPLRHGLLRRGLGALCKEGQEGVGKP